ncbi:MAG TPA: hypothetical protein VN408_16620 [Actinoplanes sp.]|nr:hypothetical protein [Actinoplanes sp.]
MNLLLPVVVMPPTVPPAQRAAWLLAGRLYGRVPEGWTIIGGQMVQFHGWRAGTVPTRATTDLDAGIAARADPNAFRILSAAVQELGLQPVLHPTGIEHRWHRQLENGGRVQVDLLLPSGLGERSQTSAHGRPGIQSHGVEWATDLSRLWHVDVEGHQMVVPVPSLLGAVVAKASALLNTSDSDPDRHLSDIVFLAQVATLADLSEPLTAQQATRVLEALDRIGRPGTEVARLRMAMARILRGQPKTK